MGGQVCLFQPLGDLSLYHNVKDLFAVMDCLINHFWVLDMRHRPIDRAMERLDDILEMLV